MPSDADLLAKPVALTQRGRSGLEILGSMQRFSSSALRESAASSFRGSAQGQRLATERATESAADVRQWVEDARRLAEQDGVYRLERFLQRYVAEDLYGRGIVAIEERRDALASRPAAQTRASGASLDLDPTVVAPAYYDVEWHLRPGGWEGYDLYAPMFALGVLPYVFRHGGYAAVPVGEDIRQQRLDVIGQLPKSSYGRIFEPGCGGGSTLLAIHALHPEAELTGCDLSACLLQDAQRLAGRLNAPVRLIQRDAAQTREPDCSYDAVVTYALHHELPFGANLELFKEMFRLLKPGGDILISDPPPFRAVSPFQAVILDWDTEHREEPFFRETCSADWDEELRKIGFVDVQSYALGPDSYPWVTRARKAG